MTKYTQGIYRAYLGGAIWKNRQMTTNINKSFWHFMCYTMYVFKITRKKYWNLTISNFLQKSVEVHTSASDIEYLLLVFLLLTTFLWSSEQSNFKHKYLSIRVNQRKIKSSWKKCGTWARFKFWPMKKILRKL